MLRSRVSQDNICVTPSLDHTWRYLKQMKQWSDQRVTSRVAVPPVWLDSKSGNVANVHSSFKCLVVSMEHLLVEITWEFPLFVQNVTFTNDLERNLSCGKYNGNKIHFTETKTSEINNFRTHSKFRQSSSKVLGTPSPLTLNERACHHTCFYLNSPSFP